LKKAAHYKLSRREFINLCVFSAAGFAAGCASNPVTGKSQLMLVSEAEEIQMDRIYSPQQLSSDFGMVQDKALEQYIQSVGKQMTPLTHRPQMPYRFFPVNATYVNAYAFPGGTIACTRGILLNLGNEAELAALIGHELGHVNARHTAEIMSKSKLTSAIVGGVAMIAGSYDKNYSGIAAQIGMLGSGALLASYSRDNERQADDLGMAYMVKAGYSPDGMVGLMNMLKSMSNHKVSSADLLFATHPMSSERYQTAVKTADEKYKAAKSKPLYRERYMDNTAGLRKVKNAIFLMQQGDELMAQKKYPDAESRFTRALGVAPNDYAGLVKLSQCQLMMKKVENADRSIQLAKNAYPQEAQAYFLSGFIKLNRKAYAPAFEDFSTYDKKLPGNPYVIFYKGYSLEGQDRKSQAAQHYNNFLQVVREGQQAQHAYNRLKEWGYIKS
jgi:predicted Zn-dependent protease